MEELKAWAYRDVFLETGEKEHGLYAKISTKLTKVGGGNPTREAVRALLGKMDEDPHWYPGKRYGKKRPGPAPALNPTKRQCVAKSAMALKKRGGEPTFALVVGACPNATVNTSTGMPVDKKIIYSIFRDDCYDETPDKTWDHRARLSRTALTPAFIARRLAWGHHIQNLGHNAGWYHRHVIFLDLCNTILPRTEQKAKEQALGRKGNMFGFSIGSLLFGQLRL